MNKSFFLALLLILPSFVSGQSVQVATFDVDVTPPVGSFMAYDPVKRVDELTLRARGIVLIGGEKKIVLCAVDWLGIANEGHDAFCAALAEAAGTTPDHVSVHSLHQHDAPGCDFTAEKILKEKGATDYGRYEGTFQREALQRLAEAVKTALPKAQIVTHYGQGAAEVKEVASNRRLPGPGGRIRAMRLTTAKDPAIRAEPEGTIDPEVTLLSFWNGDAPVAVLSYYACHPQSYYRMGIPSPDFPGIARFFRGQDVPEALHVHFNGAGGNIGAGKYNDGNRANRLILAQRLADGMKRAYEATEKLPLTAADIGWAYEPVILPTGKHLLDGSYVASLPKEPMHAYAAKLAWLSRRDSGHQIRINCLRIGQARVLHLPGELFVEYQLAAKAMRPDLKVSMAAYGDYGTGYIGTAVAYGEGGYETSDRACNTSPEVEAVLMGAMKKLLQK
ncbi:hypothetical protein WJU23_01200 [Prosthecobacter sp. SYSU 5D2]|uniref:hypothetical protein n=1 Tax=Prosthecobacter sp. SYSU 5D2 TaxID=3134134 RepID=UPI0031FEF7B9